MAFLGTTDPDLNVARGLVAGQEGFSKFGFNTDLDTADGSKVIWDYKATGWTKLSVAETLDITSTSGSDVAVGVGARSVTIIGLDASGEPQEVTIVQSGTWRTTETWTAVNRVVVATAGATGWNVGDIRVFGTGSGSTQAFMPATASITKQLIFGVRTGYTAYIEHIYISCLKTSGGSSPVVTLKAYKEENGIRYEMGLDKLDVAVSGVINQAVKNTMKVAGGGFWWVEAETDSNNTFIRGRIEQKIIKV